MSPAYSHDPVVLAQVEECLSLPPSRLMDRVGVSAASDGADKIREETLVVLAREFRRREMESMAWKMMLELCSRVKPAVYRAARLWRLGPVASDEFIESTIVTLYDVILDIDDSDEFWEIKFWVCFERRLLTALRKHRITEDRSQSISLDDRHAEDQTCNSATAHDRFADPALRAVVAEGLAQLPENLRTAFMLKHWAGFPERSVDRNDKATIARIMKVSDRTVRNYLSRAESLLNEWRKSEFS